MILECASVLIGVALASVIEVQSLNHFKYEMKLDDIEFIELLSKMALEQDDQIGWQSVVLISFTFVIWFYHL